MKKVTIVIPVYNGSNYMKDAIDSALAQTYKNLEVIVVNDGSNDDGKTKAIAESYGDKIRYFEKENGGVSTALNLAIEKMTGEYFSWLSHDDMYYPNKIEREMEELKKYDDNTILYSNFDLINEKGEKTRSIYLDHNMLTAKSDYAVLRGAIGGITLLIPKKVFKEEGLFDPKLRCVQDYELWFRVLDKYKFVHLEDILAMTRIHPNQDTNTSPKMLSEGNWLWTYMTENYPKAKKIAYEGSEYLFYKEMVDYLQATPYKEAIETISNLAEKSLNIEKEKMLKKEITVIIIDNSNKAALKRTISSLKKQSYKNYKILIEGKTKIEKIDNTENRQMSIKSVKTDFYTFLTAGVECSENWLEEEVLVACVTSKALVISEYNINDHLETVDNLSSLLIPIDGIIFNSKYKEKYKEQYQYLYDLAKKGGSITTNKKYLTNVKVEYNMSELYDFLNKVISDHNASDYQIAALCYDITCLYNKYAKTDKKVYMYEPCNELKEMMFSRSFRLLKKYMDKKKKRREKKNAK